MQDSSALRKIDDYGLQHTEDEKEPQFGDRSAHKHKTSSALNSIEQNVEEIVSQKEETPKIATVVTEVTEQRILRIANADNQIESEPEEILAIPLYSPDEAKSAKSALVPTILKDVFAHSISFVLILLATFLAVYKVHIV